ncbi:MAG: 4-hydroxybenzoyl-CoA thioesterase, partial [Pseudomonadota bacterium]
HRPARYDDLLSVETRFKRIGGASLALDQRLIRPGEEGPLVAARVDVACVRLASGRPARLPAPLRERLDALAADRDSASAGAPPLDAAEAAR